MFCAVFDDMRAEREKGGVGSKGGGGDKKNWEVWRRNDRGFRVDIQPTIKYFMRRKGET